MLGGGWGDTKNEKKEKKKRRLKYCLVARILEVDGSKAGAVSRCPLSI